MKISDLIAKNNYLNTQIEILLKDKEINSEQLSKIKAENERLKHVLNAKESINQLYKSTAELRAIDFSDLVRENTKLQQQLKEKDKEIAFLKEKDTKLYESIEKIKLDNEKQQISSIEAYQRVILRLKDKLKLNTKQVCEKIKNEIIGRYAYFVDDKDTAQIEMDVMQLIDILDQIEKGE